MPLAKAWHRHNTLLSQDYKRQAFSDKVEINFRQCKRSQGNFLEVDCACYLAGNEPRVQKTTKQKVTQYIHGWLPERGIGL